jgi:hypothetical protein
MDSRPPAMFVGGALGLDFLNSIATPVDTAVDWLEDGEGYLTQSPHLSGVQSAFPAVARRGPAPR